MKPIVGVAEAVQAIDAMVCVASSGTLERIRRSLDIAGLRDLFEPNIYSAPWWREASRIPICSCIAAAAVKIAPQHCLVIETAWSESRRRGGRACPSSASPAARILSGTNQAERLAEIGAERVFADMARCRR